MPTVLLPSGKGGGDGGKNNGGGEGGGGTNLQWSPCLFFSSLLNPPLRTWFAPQVAHTTILYSVVSIRLRFISLLHSLIYPLAVCYNEVLLY